MTAIIILSLEDGFYKAYYEDKYYKLSSEDDSKEELSSDTYREVIIEYLQYSLIVNCNRNLTSNRLSINIKLLTHRLNRIFIKIFEIIFIAVRSVLSIKKIENIKVFFKLKYFSILLLAALTNGRKKIN